MRKTTISVFVLAVMLSASFAHAAGTSNASLNYVWNGTAWIPWLATSDGKPYVYLDFVNVTSNNLTVNYRAGIGEANPQRPLHISATQDANIRLQDTGGANPAAYIEFYNSTSRYGYFGLPGGERVELGLESGKDFVISGGKVGIGTASPNRNLHIRKSGDTEFTIERTLGTTAAMLFIAESGSNKIYSRSTDTTVGSVPFSILTADTERITILGNGKVGIGTANPQNTLNVIGDINATGTVYSGGAAAAAAIPGSYSGSNTANLAVPHGLGRTPVLIIITHNSGRGVILLRSDGQLGYADDSAGVEYSVTPPNSTHFFVGNAADYFKSGSSNAGTYRFTAIG